MQKFTVFSILLSLSIVLGTMDVFFHGYLNPEEDGAQDNAEDSTLDNVSEDFEESFADPTEVPPAETTIQNSEDVAAEEDGTEEIQQDAPVQLQEETPETLLSEAFFIEAGFSTPALKSALFSGLTFQFIPVDGSETEAFQWNLFDGQNYIGTLYELVYATDTGSFSSYLDIRNEAGKLAEIGTVNEVNLYGDASFYFNHKIKVKTVHMVARYGNRVFAFEYATTAHDKMKKLFDILKTLK